MSLSLATALLIGAVAEPSPLVRAMQDELKRSMAELEVEGLAAPYFIAYTVYDHEQRTVAACFGVLTEDSVKRSRWLKVEVRVGSHALDNTGFISSFDRLSPMTESITIDDNYAALRHEIWLETDRAFKSAVELFEKKRAVLESRQEIDRPGDFSHEEAIREIISEAPRSPADIDYRQLVRVASGAAGASADIQHSGATIRASSYHRTFVSSEGSLVIEPGELVMMEVVGSTQAADGMPLDHLTFYGGKRLDALPSADTLAQEATRLAQELAELRGASRAENYSGPVLVEGMAASQLVRALLADHVGGSPPPIVESPSLARFFARGSELDGKLGRPILPSGFEVIDDPTREVVAGQTVFGGYHFDDEGVPARPLTLVRHGRLQQFVRSRAPRDEGDRSNGHGRAGITGAPLAYPSNLIVRSRNGLPPAALRARLLAAVKEEGLDYGVIIRLLDVPAITRAYSPNRRRDFREDMRLLLGIDTAHQAILAFKVTPDGYETPIRGATLGKVTVRALRGILAAGRDGTSFNFVATPRPGVAIRASVTAPALLFADLDIEEPQGGDPKPPVLPRPVISGP
jgi:TldD protein